MDGESTFIKEILPIAVRLSSVRALRLKVPSAALSRDPDSKRTAASPDAEKFSSEEADRMPEPCVEEQPEKARNERRVKIISLCSVMEPAGMVIE